MHQPATRVTGMTDELGLSPQDRATLLDVLRPFAEGADDADAAEASDPDCEIEVAAIAVDDLRAARDLFLRLGGQL